MRMIKFRAKRVNGGEWVKSMTISYGTIKRKMYNVFFHERCGKVNCGIVENMCYGTEHNEYPIRLVAQIPMQDNMNTENLLTNAL